MMEKLVVEYLVIVETKNSILNNRQALSNLLKTCSDISIGGKELTYKKNIYGFEVYTKKLENTERYFHVKITCKDIEKIKEFQTLLKIIRSLFSNVSKEKPIPLWDDISFLNANKAYPLIHHIENLMRKLITKFMYIKVGIGWTKKFIPEEVKNSVKNPSNYDNGDYLYQTDFIQLANFLFKEYKANDTKKLITSIQKATKLDDLDLENLKEYVPKSNWDRYFSKHVDCELEYLRKRWTRLYSLRCKIAHNNSLNDDEFQEIKKLVKELGEMLNLAIDKLEEVELTNIEKEAIIENVNSIKIFAFYYGQKIEAKFNIEEEMVYYKGEKFSPSTAASNAKLDNGAVSAYSTNGWRFWKYHDETDDLEKYIHNLREEKTNDS